MNAYGQKYSLTSTSPASATTSIGATVEGLADYHSLLVMASIQGATGGTLDIVLQVSPDAETVSSGTRRWVDKIRYPQLAASAAATTRIVGLSRGEGSGATPLVGAFHTTTTTAIGVNSVNLGDFGRAMRVIYIAGASTSAGAEQTIEVYGST